MRILVLHSRYLSGSISGENRVVEDEVRLLREAGHELHVWTPSAEGIEAGSSRDPRLWQAGVRVVWSRYAASRVRELIRRHRPDIVHCHNLFPMLSPSVLRAGAKGAAVVVTLHNYRLLCLPSTFVRDGAICEACLGRLPWRGVVYRCYRGSALGSGAVAASLGVHRALHSFERVRLFLAVSEHVREKHIEAGFPPQRIHVKPNFVWEVPQREGAGDYFLYLGRLSPEKDVSTLLEAWRSAPGRLLVVGDGPDAARLRRAAPPAVEFRGAVAATDVPALLSRARSLLLPSRSYEGAPRSLLEAYAGGVPVIASRIGALPELVQEGVSGVLVPLGDAAAWAEAVERLTQETVAERLGEGARRLWYERYSPTRGLEQLEEAYDRCLD